jgi:hypothetical protein
MIILFIIQIIILSVYVGLTLMMVAPSRSSFLWCPSSAVLSCCCCRWLSARFRRSFSSITHTRTLLRLAAHPRAHVFIIYIYNIIYTNECVWVCVCVCVCERERERCVYKRLILLVIVCVPMYVWLCVFLCMCGLWYMSIIYYVYSTYTADDRQRNENARTTLYFYLSHFRAFSRIHRGRTKHEQTMFALMKILLALLFFRFSFLLFFFLYSLLAFVRRTARVSHHRHNAATTCQVFLCYIVCTAAVVSAGRQLSSPR